MTHDPHFVAKLASVSSRDELDGFQSARTFTVDELRAIRDRRAALERAWK